MAKLEELTLNDNMAINLEVGVFDQLTSLRTLDLSNCGLTLDMEYHRNLFKNLVCCSFYYTFRCYLSI